MARGEDVATAGGPMAGPEKLGAPRLARLPAAEFSYIGRPAETFEGRWAAIEEALAVHFGSAAFTMVDVGSNHGYFSLSAALRFPAAQVVGVEGSVGIGNGALGSCTRSAAQLAATEAVRTHLGWTAKLQLGNCLLAPEVWDLDRVRELRQLGFRASAMLELSVVHHIDGICQEAYARDGLGRVEGSLQLLASILQLADVHVLELPDRPWLDHLHDRFGTPRAIIEAALALTGEEWELRQIYRNEWFGVRELWLLASRCQRPHRASLREAFPTLLPGDELPAAAGLGSAAPPGAGSLGGAALGAQAAAAEPSVPVTGDAAFAADVLAGVWSNACRATIEVSGQPPQLQCVYRSEPAGLGGHQGAGESRELLWDGAEWKLASRAGCFTLQAATAQRLTWREVAAGWSTSWQRV